ISLALLTTLMALIVPISFNRMNDLTEQQFLKIFSNDILYTQNLAMNYPEKNVRLRFRENHYEIVIDHSGKIEIKREIPPNWEIYSYTIDEISFNKVGTIRYAGTINIITPSATYEIVFPLGKGREYIVKK